MTRETLAALCLFSVITSITPGPNNIMLLASGVNFGFRRTLPHTLGISTGLCTLLLSVGLGLGTLLSAFPPLHTVLKVLGSAYMLYLAFQVASSHQLTSVATPAGQATTHSQPQETTLSRPMTFFQAVLFQWVNPKAWVMAVSSMALYTSASRPYASVLTVAAIFSLLNWPSCSTWAVFGQSLRGFLASRTRLKWFNIAMGLLLAASVVVMIR
ncbi:MAG: LysE family translocator [Cyanobacteria bacterium P01_D01_bin.105]